MKKLILILSMFIILIINAEAKSFSDVKEGAWYYESIIELAEDGVINGYNDGSFKPKKVITKAEFIKIYLEALDEDIEIMIGDKWYNPYLRIVMNKKWMSNLSEENVSEVIKREEIAELISKSLELDDINSNSNYVDVDSDNNYYNDILKVSNVNLINGVIDIEGTQKFNPKGNANRAESAVIIKRVMKYRDESSIEEIKEIYLNEAVTGKYRVLCKDGNIYVGNIKEGMKAGKGILYDNDANTIFKGTYKNNNPIEGEYYGVTERGNKVKCIGEFYNDYEKFKGKVYKGTELIFDADFSNGFLTGKGTMYWAETNEKYIGEIKDATIHGKGTWYYEDGIISEKGTYSDGELDGRGQIYTREGKLFVDGEFENGDLKKGTAYMESGGVYVGEFKELLFDGQGKMYNKDNEVIYEGKWEKGKPVEKSKLIKLNNEWDIKAYLEKTYSELNTSIGKTKFEFRVRENDSKMFAYDYTVYVKYDFSFMYKLKYSIKVDSKTQKKVKEELKDFQEEIAKDLISLLPNKKIKGGYHYSWYEYPNIQVGYNSRDYYTWSNYEEADIFEDDNYSNSKKTKFHWTTDMDDEL